MKKFIQLSIVCLFNSSCADKLNIFNMNMIKQVNSQYKFSNSTILKSAKTIDTLLITKNGLELADFYKKNFSLSFSHWCEKDLELFICNDQPITIYSKDLKEYSGGLLQYESGNNGYNEIDVSYCKDDVFVNANLKLVNSHEILSKRTLKEDNYWYSILRSENPYRLQNFFSPLGKWNEEQHNNGPIHYNLSNECGRVYEIYPMSTSIISKMQFFIPQAGDVVYDNFIYDNDGRAIKTLKNYY